MAHTYKGESSKRSGGDKMKGLESKASRHLLGQSSYRLFPEPGHTHCNMTPLHDVLKKQPQTQDNQSRSEVLTLDLPKVTQFPFNAMKQPSCLAKGEVEMSNNVPVSTSDSSSWFSNYPATVQQVTLMNHGKSHSSYLPSHAPGRVESIVKDFADIMAAQQAYFCALQNPNQVTPTKLLQQSPHALKNHYAHDIYIISHSGQNPANAITQQPQRISGSLPIQYCGQNINRSCSVQQRMWTPVENAFMIIRVKGQIAGLCANPHGSRLIQHALETATPKEIIMVYEEVIPCARMLTTNMYANYVVQKLLDHGSQFYKRKFISNLIGHVQSLSLHMYGCRVIEKAFEVSDQDLKVQMANELYGEVQRCARNQYANHVLQKCMECVPAQHIQFIFRSFCKKAKAFSTTPYGCHVIKKVMTFCNNTQIYRTLVSEIMKVVVKLALDPFGNYVVQHVVEHGGPFERSMIVKKLKGHVLSMSYHKYASHIIEKCLMFCSFQDRQLLTTEILTAGDGQHFNHLPEMMCHMYANFVIKKLATMADEGQLRVVVEVAHHNMATIMRYQHGRHVLAHIQKVLTDRGMNIRIADPQSNTSGAH